VTARIHPSVFIAPGALVMGDVTLGADASVWYGAVLRGDMAPIIVGAETNLQDGTVVHVDDDEPCTIGRRVGVGHRVILHGCTVEDECLIGMGSVLLNGVRVGTGSVVAAGAVIPEGMQVPPRSLVMGVPGRIVRIVDGALAERIAETW
jgi:carbonic anhydrase/acetyltransferase-like protein (isoleucine patch superfamily)